MRRDREEDLERELRSHLELEAEQQLDSGLTPEQAHNAARRLFGNVTFTKEEVRRMWGGTIWEIFVQDMRYAFRALRKNPGFAATALLTLALGIGASTAVFTVVDSVVLKPLAYRDSGRLVVAWERPRILSGDVVGPNPLHVDFWQKRARAFTGLTLVRNLTGGVTRGPGDHPRRAGTVTCMPNLFDVLEAAPMLGRGFLPEDGVKGHDEVAILTYPLWQSLFNGDPGAIGSIIRVDDLPRKVIGILPAGFQFPNANALKPSRSRQQKSGTPEPAVFLPAVFEMDQFSWNGEYGNWVALARLSPGTSVQQAEAQLQAIEAQILEEMPASQRDNRPGALTALVQPMQDAIVGDSRTALWLLMSAVIGLMLIACLNLANAQLGRSLARRREAAVRAALGAARWRLLWNALAENLLLAVTGGAAGIGLAAAAIDLFRRYAPVDLPRLSEVHINGTVLLFSITLSFSATIAAGILPALRQTSLQPYSSRTVGSYEGSRLRTWLIGLEVFGCTALLLITGLFSKSLIFLLRQDRGFETAHVAIAEASLSTKTYSKVQSRVSFDDGVLQNLRALPGVEKAGMVSAMPLEGEAWIEPLVRIGGPKQDGTLVNARWVSPGYFETTGQKLVAGRFFEERDRNLNSLVLSEAEAKTLWKGEDPIGGQARVLGLTCTVIGVVADSRSTSLKTAPPRMAYVHYKDRTPYTMFFVVRSAQTLDALIAGMRQAIWSSAPDAIVGRVKTLDSQLADSLARERFQTLVLVAFGVAALFLAMLGIYGVLNYSVAMRKQEIGVRMALGATRLRICVHTLAQAGRPVVAGLAAGLVAAVFAEDAIRKLLFGVQGVDAPVIAMVIGLFLAAAAAAAFLPARRAASVDPMDALRSE